MTPAQEKKLDILYKETGLSNGDYLSILDGEANLIHHFLQGRYKSIRWYMPCGIPLGIEQHNNIHGYRSKTLQNKIIAIKGREWLNNLHRQKFKIAKNLDYNKVADHILG